MARYLQINNKTNLVENAIELDPDNIFDGKELPEGTPDPRYRAQEGSRLEPCEYGTIGDTWPVKEPKAQDDPDAETLAKILVLEEAQTPRRLREAVLGTDDGWLEDTDKKIIALRKKLT